MPTRTPPRARARPGFTLIELLVVVAIITLLIAILLPSLGGARRRARTVKCAANLRSWGTAVASFTASNDGYLPKKGDDGDKSTPVGWWDDPDLWFNALPRQMTPPFTYSQLQEQSAPLNPGAGPLPIGGTNNIFICPEATTAQPAAKDASDATDGPYFQEYGYMGPPNDSNPMGTGGISPRRTFFCYVWNSKMAQSGGGLADNSITANNTRVRVTQGNANQILMIEKRMRADELKPGDADNPLASLDPTGTLGFNNAGASLQQSKGMWTRFTERHADGGNLLFVDGHVDTVKYHDLNTPSQMPAGLVQPGDWNHPGQWVWNPYGPATH